MLQARLAAPPAMGQIRRMGFRIAIAGAGIGGLAAAALLAQGGHDITLFERFDQPRPLGSGLVIQPVGLAVLDMLGLGDGVRDLSSPIAHMLGHSGRRTALDVHYPADAPGRASTGRRCSICCGCGFRRLACR